MTGLIEDIQAMALDPTVNVSFLLRRVKLASVKLGLDDATEWVDRELKGYEKLDDVPSYRHSKGELRAHTVYNGIVRVAGQSEWIEKICSLPICDSITRVESLSGEGTEEAIFRVAGPFEAALNKSNNSPGTQYYVHTAQIVFKDIIEQVRNAILDWAIGLEKAGILGDGIGFTMEEKEKAAEVAPSIHIENFTGNFHQGDVTGNQNRTMIESTDNSKNSLNLTTVFEQLIQAVNAGVSKSDDREALIKIIDGLEKTKGTTGYMPWFQKIVGYAADYATLLGPFLPTLSQVALQTQ